MTDNRLPPGYIPLTHHSLGGTQSNTRSEGRGRGENGRSSEGRKNGGGGAYGQSRRSRNGGGRPPGGKGRRGGGRRDTRSMPRQDFGGREDRDEDFDEE